MKRIAAITSAAKESGRVVELAEQLRAVAMYHVRRLLPAGHKPLVGDRGPAAAGLAVGTAAHRHRRRASGGPCADKGEHLLVDAAVLTGEKRADRRKNNAVFQLKPPDLKGGQYNGYTHNMVSFFKL